MSKYYEYKKGHKKDFRKILRFLGLGVSAIGILSLIYIFLPLISWQIYFAPTFASDDVAAPIPKTTIVNSSTIKSLFSNAANSISGTNYLDAQNWFPNYKTGKIDSKITNYALSIPKLGIKNANVSTVDTELDKHLVNYPGTAVAPEKGNSVIFGHSTLPQLFNPNDYKTIFATLHTLKIGDEFSVNVGNVIYTYKIHSITIVDPSNTSIFFQDTDNSHITLVTCTPPGTTWKRLIIKASLEKLK